MSRTTTNRQQTNTPEAVPFTHLDIGGGPDILPEDTSDRYVDRLQMVRAAMLAAEHPDRAYIVFDPLLDTAVAERVQDTLPNVTFTEGKVDRNHKLPYPDQSMNVVEMNHLLYPLFYSRNIKWRENQLEDKTKEFASEFLATQQQVEARLSPYRQELTKFIEIGIGEPTPQDAEYFMDYIAAIKEAARVLKPGGTLMLAEKRGRMDRIVRLLTETGEDGRPSLLDEIGLQMGEVANNQDPNRSRYAEMADLGLEAMGGRLTPEKAALLVPVKLEFRKA